MANPNERPMKTTDVGGRQLPYPQGWNQAGGPDGQGDWEATRVKDGKLPVLDEGAATLLQALVTALAGVLHVDVGNLPADQLIHGPVTATQGPPGAQAWPVADADTFAKVEQVRALLAGTLAVGDANSLAKLEAIRLLLAGTVAVADADSLAKLETIRQLLAGTVAVADANTLAKVEQVRALLAGTLTTQLSGRNLSLLTETLLLALLKETTSGAGVVPVAQVAENALDSLDNKKVNITRREPTPIQTHSAVTVALSGSSSSSIQTAYGFDSVAVGIRSDASHLRRVEIEWYADSAGSSLVEIEIIVASATKQYGAGRTTVKAGYFKVALKNEDAGAAHVMSSWTTLMP